MDGSVGPYLRRVVDGELDGLLDGLAAVELNGAHGVGKTSTARARARTVFELDLPDVREIVASDTARVTHGPFPVLIDEWQRIPATWDRVRRAVDADRTPGRFLLTGSASPRTPPSHSGAGRIVSVRMRPMTLSERGVDRPTVSLAAILRGDRPAIDGATDVSLERYAREIICSGFPGLRTLPERQLRRALDGYLQRVTDDEYDLATGVVRDRVALRRWMAAYAAAVSSATSYEKIRDAATAGHGEKPAKTTVLRYLDILESMWLIEPIPAWAPIGSDLNRMTLAPKHQLVDPALAARLRNLSMDDLLRGRPAGPLAARHASVFGALFESLVTLSVLVYAQAAEGRVSHFRTFGGEHEVDLIVEGAASRVVAIEVKLAETVGDSDVRHLVWLRERIGDRLLDAVIVTTGRYAYRRKDGIAVVPAALLGP